MESEVGGSYPELHLWEKMTTSSSSFTTGEQYRGESQVQSTLSVLEGDPSGTLRVRRRDVRTWVYRLCRIPL